MWHLSGNATYQALEQENQCALSSDFHFEVQIFAALRVQFHPDAKWIEFIHSELEIINAAPLHGGEYKLSLSPPCRVKYRRPGTIVIAGATPRVVAPVFVRSWRF